jgi:hypothetical protein
MENALQFRGGVLQSLFPEFSDKDGADKAVVAGDEDFTRIFHPNVLFYFTFSKHPNLL